jgi:hypothetical protein
VTVPGGKPVMEVPDQSPRFPPMELGPVLVTVVPPRTANKFAAPSPTFTVVA